MVSAPKEAMKRKTVASAPKTVAKRSRKDSISNNDIIQEQAGDNDSDEDDNIQEPPPAANASINELLGLSDDGNNPSEGNSLKLQFILF